MSEFKVGDIVVEKHSYTKCVILFIEQDPNANKTFGTILVQHPNGWLKDWGEGCFWWPTISQVSQRFIEQLPDVGGRYMWRKEHGLSLDNENNANDNQEDRGGLKYL
jgi:hypothetical protein